MRVALLPVFRASMISRAILAFPLSFTAPLRMNASHLQSLQLAVVRIKSSSMEIVYVMSSVLPLMGFVEGVQMDSLRTLRVTHVKAVHKHV